MKYLVTGITMFNGKEANICEECRSKADAYRRKAYYENDSKVTEIDVICE